MTKQFSAPSLSGQLLYKFRLEIINGKYPPGTQFPAVRVLAYAESVNPNTVQKVLGLLEEDGVLICHGTKGRFVTEDEKIIQKIKLLLQTEYLESVRSGARDLGITTKQFMQFLQESEESLP